MSATSTPADEARSLVRIALWIVVATASIVAIADAASNIIFNRAIAFGNFETRLEGEHLLAWAGQIATLAKYTDYGIYIAALVTIGGAGQPRLVRTLARTAMALALVLFAVKIVATTVIRTDSSITFERTRWEMITLAKLSGGETVIHRLSRAIVVIALFMMVQTRKRRVALGLTTLVWSATTLFHSYFMARSWAPVPAGTKQDLTIDQICWVVGEVAFGVAALIAAWRSRPARRDADVNPYRATDQSTSIPIVEDFQPMLTRAGRGIGIYRMGILVRLLMLGLSFAAVNVVKSRSALEFATVGPPLIVLTAEILLVIGLARYRQLPTNAGAGFAIVAFGLMIGAIMNDATMLPSLPQVWNAQPAALLDVLRVESISRLLGCASMTFLLFSAYRAVTFVGHTYLRPVIWITLASLLISAGLSYSVSGFVTEATSRLSTSSWLKSRSSHPSHPPTAMNMIMLGMAAAITLAIYIQLLSRLRGALAKPEVAERWAR